MNRSMATEQAETVTTILLIEDDMFSIVPGELTNF